MSAVALLTGKDLRTLVRSRVLLVLLVAYPLVIALLLGNLLLGASRSASIALVNEDRTGTSVDIGGARFGIDQYRTQAARAGVTIVDMQRPDAMRALREGQVSGVLVIPDGFIASLQSTLSPAHLALYTGDNPLGDSIADRVRGAIYNVNLDLSTALVKYNASYLRTLVSGGGVSVLGRTYTILGLQPAQQRLTQARAHIADPAVRQQLDDVIGFARDTGTALTLANKALEAAAQPVRLDHRPQKGKSPRLTARALSFALAVSLAFVCVMLVAASLAAERDEHVLARLVRGIARGWQVLLAKLLLGIALGAVFSLGLFVVFAVLAPQAWTRLPMLLAAVAIAALAYSAVGTLLATITRDARTAVLVGILVVLPMIPLGLLPGNGVAHVLSQCFPFAPAQHLFNATLFDLHPWRAAASSALQLLAIAGIAFAASLRLLRRLV